MTPRGEMLVMTHDVFGNITFVPIEKAWDYAQYENIHLIKDHHYEQHKGDK